MTARYWVFLFFLSTFLTLWSVPNRAYAFIADYWALSLQQDYFFSTSTKNAAKKLDDSAGKGAEEFVRSMGNEAIRFLSDPSLTQDQKKNKFKKLLRNSFDMNTIARFAIGKYWRTASKEQQSEYKKLFEAMVVEVYAQRFDEYQGQSLDVRAYRVNSPKDTIVTSYIVPGEGPEIKVDWRVRYKKGKYKIVDVIIEGVSMSLTQRSDFSSVIQRGGGDVAVLIAHLKD